MVKKYLLLAIVLTICLAEKVLALGNLQQLTGQLFVRHFSEIDTCQDGFFLYLIYENRKLIGFGHAVPGIASPGPNKIVYNYREGHILKELLPHPPPCFYEMAKYGFTAVGLWMIEDPWNIRCPICLCKS